MQTGKIEEWMSLNYWYRATNNPDLVNKHIVPTFVECLASRTGTEAEVASRVLARIPWDCMFFPDIIRTRGIPALVGLLSSSKGDEASWAAAALKSITADNHYPRYYSLDAGAVPALIRMMSSKKDIEVKNSAGALANLVAQERCAAASISEGVLPLLVRLLRKSLQRPDELVIKEQDVSEQVMRLLRNIAAGDIRCKHACVSAGVIPELLEHLRLRNKYRDWYYYSKADEHCVMALYNITLGDTACKRACVDAGAVPVLTKNSHKYADRAMAEIASDFPFFRREVRGI